MLLSTISMVLVRVEFLCSVELTRLVRNVGHACYALSKKPWPVWNLRDYRIIK